MFCNACGTPQPPGAAICVRCGAAIAGMPAPRLPERTSGMAIAGFVLSFFCGLLGLIFSIIGLNQINNSGGRLGGKGLAIAGIVISVVVGSMGILAAIAIPAFVKYIQKSKAIEAVTELH